VLVEARMTHSGERVSPAVRLVLRWLIGSGQHSEGRIDIEVLCAYYERNGRAGYLGTERATTLSRRGAAGRMLRRLHDLGYVEHGSLTRAGKRAA
jgi:hypothetical protein